MPGMTRKRPTTKRTPALAARRDADAPAASVAPAKRGRPARLSRQRIVEAVLVLLERDPRTVPTISMIAREVEAVPAALYRHFASFEEILDDVMAGILAASHASPDGDAAWPRQLERWMRDLRLHLLRHPAILAMIGRSGRTSPAWLEASSALVEILGHAGLAGRELAAAYLWVLETTVGLVLQEAVMPLSDQIASARASRHAFSPMARERFAPIEREIERIDGEAFFDFAIEQAIAGIEARLHRAPRPRRAPRARSNQRGRKSHVA
ncbi:MAG: TetR/AcrR family transcriptional regulator C-terminal domain-containing protein [Deltaproteobacteria bacterium]|nr:TetR/AcrR family transcriptional regulator C-terminal domain-containing protein [Deltaproteobacteria bacterium]